MKDSKGVYCFKWTELLAATHFGMHKFAAYVYYKTALYHALIIPN